MQISARNLLKGVISNVTEGAVNGIVTISLDGVDVKANITMEAINQLGLAEGKEAFAIIKASNVMFALGEEPITNISARNQLAGTVSEIKRGAVNGHVAIELAQRPEGHRLHHERGHREPGPGSGHEGPRRREVHRRHRRRGVTARSLPSAATCRSTAWSSWTARLFACPWLDNGERHGMSRFQAPRSRECVALPLPSGYVAVCEAIGYGS